MLECYSRNPVRKSAPVNVIFGFNQSHISGGAQPTISLASTGATTTLSVPRSLGRTTSTKSRAPRSVHTSQVQYANG